MNQTIVHQMEITKNANNCTNGKCNESYMYMCVCVRVCICEIRA